VESDHVLRAEAYAGGTQGSLHCRTRRMRSDRRSTASLASWLSAPWRKAVASRTPRRTRSLPRCFPFRP